MLWTFPFKATLAITKWLARPGLRESRKGRFRPGQITRAVSAAGRRMLREKPCLTQALAALVLYKQQGYPAHLRIGVAKDEEGKLKAHAWVESEGRIAIGKLRDLSDYTVLPDLRNLKL